MSFGVQASHVAPVCKLLLNLGQGRHKNLLDSTSAVACCIWSVWRQPPPQSGCFFPRHAHSHFKGGFRNCLNLMIPHGIDLHLAALPPCGINHPLTSKACRNWYFKFWCERFAEKARTRKPEAHLRTRIPEPKWRFKYAGADSRSIHTGHELERSSVSRQVYTWDLRKRVHNDFTLQFMSLPTFQTNESKFRMSLFCTEKTQWMEDSFLSIFSFFSWSLIETQPSSQAHGSNPLVLT